MDDKIRRIKEAMMKKNIDILLATSEPNIRYFTGKSELACIFVIPLEDKPFILTYPLEADRAKESGYETFSVSEKVKADIKEKSLSKAMQTVARSKKIKMEKIGYENEILPYGDFVHMKKILKKTFAPFSNEILEIRAIKNRSEAEKIKKAAEIADKGMRTAFEAIRAGVREADVAAEIEFAMRKAGADWFSFQTIVGSGSNSALPHHTVSGKIIKSTDFVVVDIGAVYRGYCSDTSRTFCIKPDMKKQKIYNIVLEAQTKAENMIAENISAKKIYFAARDRVRKAGYDIIHTVGHGVGIEAHEFPNISPLSNEKLSSGMVFTIEPGIYIRKYGGVRIEDMVLLTGKGIKILTKSEKSLSM